MTGVNATIAFTGGVNPNLAYQFQSACAHVLSASVDRLTVICSSRGGDITAGMAIYNLLRMLPCRVRMINAGQCGSIAATIFLAGEERIALPASNFFLHAATYVEGDKAGQIAPVTALISAPYRDLPGWDEARMTRFFTSAADVSLDAKEAFSLGIATAVATPRLDPGEAMAVLDPERSAPPPLDLFAEKLHKRPRRSQRQPAR